MYVVITGSEDGTQFATCKNEAELQTYLADAGIRSFRKDFKDMDTNYWGGDEALLLKAEVIVPKPKKIVEAWEF
jgi:hypothetical protein